MGVVALGRQDEPTKGTASNLQDDPLLASILGEPEGEGSLQDDTDEGKGTEGLGGVFGTGDLAGMLSVEEPEAKKAKERSEWQAVLRAVQADLPPTVGFIFRSWVMRHKDLAEGVPLPTLFSWWIINMAHRDFVGDQQRSEEERQYDPAGLYVEDLLPMIQAEARAEREAIMQEVRQSLIARLQPLVESRVIPQEVFKLLEGPSGG